MLALAPREADSWFVCHLILAVTEGIMGFVLLINGPGTAPVLIESAHS